MPRFLVRLAILAAAFLATVADAADVAVVLDDSKPGTYLVTIGADGSVTASPLRVVRVGANPSPPTNPPPMSDTPLQARVKQLTREALAAGGKPETAARLAGVYALVSDFCLDGTVSPEMIRGTAEKPGLLSQATDAALKDVADKAAWTAWRQGIGTELALRHPAGAETTKELLAGTLREVSSAIKNHLGVATAANGEKLTIPWEEIIELLRPILRDLLIKFLTDWIKNQ